MTTRVPQTDPYVSRKAKRASATKQELIKVIEKIEEHDYSGLFDKEKLHELGIHEYITDYDCEECFRNCDNCESTRVPMEDLEVDDLEQHICTNCLAGFEKIAIRRRAKRKREPNT